MVKKYVSKKGAFITVDNNFWYYVNYKGKVRGGMNDIEKAYQIADNPEEYGFNDGDILKNKTPRIKPMRRDEYSTPSGIKRPPTTKIYYVFSKANHPNSIWMIERSYMLKSYAEEHRDSIIRSGRDAIISTKKIFNTR